MTQRTDSPPVETILGRLSPRSRSALATCELPGPVQLDAGATVLSEGLPTPFLAVLTAGRVALRLRAPGSGTPATIVTVEPGELLGWSAVVPPHRATADAVATAPVSLVAFDAPALRRLLETDHQLAAELLPVVLESVAARLAASWEQLLDLFAAPVPEPW